MGQYYRLCILLLLAASIAAGDGLMRPSDKAYPNNFLYHRMTKVDVAITGQIARTTVYHEFVNEWDKATDVVYSFPLPPDARATGLYFWSNDTMYRAVLKVKEQASNPGTGEGGIDAQVNAYLGPNALRMMIPGVPAGSIQRIQLEYISLCSYGQGKSSYRYPLNTSEFSLLPVETFILNINVTSDQTITASSMNPSIGVKVTQPGPNTLNCTAERSKIYLTSDINFSYTAPHDSLKTEFFAVDNDTMDGHFVMVLRSPTGGTENDVFKKNVVFVLDRSSNMFSASLAEAKSAIGACVRSLRADDSFNIITFDYAASAWRPALAKATQTAKDSAEQFLAGVTFSSGSALFTAVKNAIDQFPSDTTHNIILLFSDGKAAASPDQIRAYNSKKSAIVTVASASTAGRQRLEMISFLNYGIPSFIAANDLLKERVLEIFERINLPMMKDVRYEIGTNVHSIIPAIAPSLYKGSMLYFTGRYKNPGNSIFSIAGHSTAGAVFSDIPLTFPAETVKNKFAEKFWAKEKIDEIERRIAVYGENDSLKKADIAISLGYGIRCKYTSYNAEKTNPVTPPATAVDAVEFIGSAVERAADAWIVRWDVVNAEHVKEFRIYRKTGQSGQFELAAVVGRYTRSISDIGHTESGIAYRIDAVLADGRTVSTFIHTDAQTPAGFALHPNFPNPFNPVTTIRFDVPMKEHVTLLVHDIVGREIARLTDEVKEPGTYTVRMESGSLAGGMYFYTLRSGSFSTTRKMLLVK